MNNLNEGKPSAHITKNRQRIKQFNGKVYLNNGDEFEIELFNPTYHKITARITVNDESIGNDLMLRPGERVFLERFTNNNNKKFVFKTYEINGNDPEAVKAIGANGCLSVNFYKEKAAHHFGTVNVLENNLRQHDLNSSADPTFKYLYQTNYTCADNPVIGFCSTDFYSPQASYSTAMTGRIEKGSESSQNFDTDYSSQFEYFAFHSEHWQILPRENQPILSNEITLYCGHCGTKRKRNSYVFCPICGGKF